MKLPYSIQGALFAPAFALLVFVLKLTCPENGVGCFADAFITPVFLPLDFIYRVFGPRSIIVAHEPLFILLYWMIVGGLIGIFFDLYKKPKREEVV
jgi:hypothetical protein